MINYILKSWNIYKSLKINFERSRMIRTISGFTRCDFGQVPVVISLHFQVKDFGFRVASFGDEKFV